MYFGNGFTHSEVYNMPVYLRRFYYKKLLDVKKKESNEIKKVNQKSKISKPAINSRFK